MESAQGKTKQAIKGGLRKIGERQKLIRIADGRSMDGDLSLSIQADVFASSSEDE